MRRGRAQVPRPLPGRRGGRRPRQAREGLRDSVEAGRVVPIEAAQGDAGPEGAGGAALLRRALSKVAECCRDPRVPIDNNVLERRRKAFATGRKDWQICDTLAGAEASACMYSLSRRPGPTAWRREPGWSGCSRRYPASASRRRPNRWWRGSLVPRRPRPPPRQKLGRGSGRQSFVNASNNYQTR